MLIVYKGFKSGFRVVQRIERQFPKLKIKVRFLSRKQLIIINMEENIMNKLSQQLIVSVLAIFGFLFVLGIAGRYDYATEIVQSMPEAAYYTILDTLGDDCSETAIAEEYMSNRAYYDSLQY